MTAVYINARFLTQPLSGVQRYAFEVLTALDTLLERCPVGPVIACIPAGYDVKSPPWRHIELRVLPGGKGHFWEQTTLWRASRNGLLISLGNSGPVLHPSQFLALHDANIYAIPQAFSWTYRAFHKTIRPILARRAARLITVSSFSAQELGRQLRVPASRFRIIPNSADHMLKVPADPGALKRNGLLAGRYLLSVGNQSPNKNIANLVKAHAGASGLPVLAVIGGSANGISNAGLAGSQAVRVLGRVSDGALRSLYEGAMGFVFPSLYEGFGIPALEAMVLGTPVLASRTSAMPEVLGSAARYFDPMDICDIRRALAGFCAMPPSERAAMAIAGRRRAERFSWDESATSLHDMIGAFTSGPSFLSCEGYQMRSGQ